MGEGALTGRIKAACDYIRHNVSQAPGGEMLYTAQLDKLDDIEKYIAVQKANAAHAAIQAFLETTYEEADSY